MQIRYYEDKAGPKGYVLVKFSLNYFTWQAVQKNRLESSFTEDDIMEAWYGSTNDWPEWCLFDTVEEIEVCVKRIYNMANSTSEIIKKGVRIKPKGFIQKTWDKVKEFFASRDRGALP